MIVAIVGDVRSFAVRGLAALLFGVVTLIWPALTLNVLVLLFGAFVLIDGVTTLYAVAKREPGTEQRRGWLLLEGIVSLVAGAITFLWPGITALALLYVIAAWALVAGSMKIATAIRLRRAIRGEWLLAASGALNVVFAALLVIFPGAGALAITWLIGWFAAFDGIMLLALAWRLHKLEDTLADEVRGFGAATA
jgi:uncharacterized membrane protein HdeD (DUF308 family)